MSTSPFRKGLAPQQTGGPGSSEGEAPEPPYPSRVVAFTDRPVLIIWIDQRGNKLREQTVTYEDTA